MISLRTSLFIPIKRSLAFGKCFLFLALLFLGKAAYGADVLNLYIPHHILIHSPIFMTTWVTSKCAYYSISAYCDLDELTGGRPVLLYRNYGKISLPILFGLDLSVPVVIERTTQGFPSGPNQGRLSIQSNNVSWAVDLNVLYYCDTAKAKLIQKIVTKLRKAMPEKAIRKAMDNYVDKNAWLIEEADEKKPKPGNTIRK